MRVIGTAGHVDHGKSTLIQALTGTHPDRLKEEREREMTIDLGFAWWQLPGGEEIGVVDVPGHRDFISNMLSGIGGIDAVILVIAADEGVMPQTREHLAILDLLNIDSGVVAITKIDLVEDPTWIELVQQDIQDLLTGTSLEHAEQIPISSTSKQGLDTLQNALEKVLQSSPPRADKGRPRLAVDRVFTMAGFGAVVTGTLLDGQFQIGDEITIFPENLKGRIRGLQSHKRKLELAIPGSRTAINISGVEASAIQRGSVISHPGTYEPTRRFDAHISLLPDAGAPLKHDTELKLFIASAETIARVRVLGVKEISPGDQAWIQLELREAVIAEPGDRFILRRPSPAETIGGGTVVDSHPAKRHKRFSDGVINRLEILRAGSPIDLFLDAASTTHAATLSEITTASQLDVHTARQAAQDLIEKGNLLILTPHADQLSAAVVLAVRTKWEALERSLVQELEQYHQQHPLRSGMPRQDLRGRLDIPPPIFKHLVEYMSGNHSLCESGPLLYLPSHQVSFDADQKNQVNDLLEDFNASPYSPPSVKECIAQIGEPLYRAIVHMEILLPVSNDVVFRREDFEQMREEVRAYIATHGSISVSQARDHFDTTRRYVLALLEHLDTLGITKREGDTRILK